MRAKVWVGKEERGKTCLDAFYTQLRREKGRQWMMNPFSFLNTLLTSVLVLAHPSIPLCLSLAHALPHSFFPSAPFANSVFTRHARQCRISYLLLLMSFLLLFLLLSLPLAICTLPFSTDKREEERQAGFRSRGKSRAMTLTILARVIWANHWERQNLPHGST